MNRHPKGRIINVKRYIQTKKKKAKTVKTSINDLRKEKDQVLEITKVLLDQFNKVRDEARPHSSSNKELVDLIKKLNQKIDAIKRMLVNEENKTKAQVQKLKSVESDLAEFVYVTIDELNEMTKESRSLVQELQKKNNQDIKLFPSLFDIHSIPQESKPSRKRS